MHDPSDQIPAKQIKKLSDYLKNVTIDITDTKGFDAAQCTAGGIRTKEIYADTLKSRIVSGLYFAGEVIDIDGMCGDVYKRQPILRLPWQSPHLKTKK